MPNFRGLIQESHEEKIETGDKSGLDAARIISSTWENSPEVLQCVIVATIAGKVSLLNSLVDQHNITAEQLLEMRGVECKAFCQVNLSQGFLAEMNSHKKKNDKSISGKCRHLIVLDGKRSVILETQHWNPVHFATFYKQKAVLAFFQDQFGFSVDLRYCMAVSEADLLGAYEGALLVSKKTGQSTFQQLQSKR